MSAIHDTPQGTAYGRPPQHPNDLPTRVGPGTPCGELMHVPSGNFYR